MKRRAIPAISLALVVLFSASFLLALPGAVSMPASAVTQAEIDALKESAGELEQQQKEIQAQLNAIAADKDEAIKGQDFEKAAELRDKQEKLEADRKQKEDSWREGESDVKMVVDEDVIAEVISSTTGIPVFKLTQAESKKLLNMEAELHKRIIGQDEAVSALSRSIRFVHLRRPHRRRQDRAGQDARRIPVRR